MCVCVFSYFVIEANNSQFRSTHLIFDCLSNFRVLQNGFFVWLRSVNAPHTFNIRNDLPDLRLLAAQSGNLKYIDLIYSIYVEIGTLLPFVIIVRIFSRNVQI